MAHFEQQLLDMYAQRFADAKMLAQPSTLDRLLEACERHLSVIEKLATRRQSDVKCSACDRVVAHNHTHPLR